ncbi:aminoglycoside phosphotransferase family protein [Scandinavium sp. V105_16]|uniref:Aminoglycoside phosphotransferase family protein n=1 Tax=Scandinavium lactucae TaxID=3095028 RepID=A0AAJ2VVC1_9ENTR|nr:MULTISPECIES: aminoglycoside phosphotransferase family protein [unclassified Scandinavium]MDX6022202.1 aminoglycoside phosphotransferase family protein [Scandinavium sp. V105_16]MDX6033956.1 aminoglycoside phosphotransferase family protein [Scandinavium sp. V105_12]
MEQYTLTPWLHRWKLIPDGTPFITHTSQLLPVRTATGLPAMLKITDDKDEQTGNALMAWWAGNGSAPVIAHENEAILLARATGTASLAAMSRHGEDTEACRVMCLTAHRLHTCQKQPLSQLTPLDEWFTPLTLAANEHGGFLIRSAEIAAELLAAPREVIALHGDLHHDNVLDFGESGWLAIDPKGLIGERGFDYANIFTNPDLGNPTVRVAPVAEIFRQRLAIVTGMAGLDRERLLKWIIAWCGLSATWSLERHELISIQSRVAELAIAELDP